jgi:CHAT domain-containing protein/Flp pilus assembly protein TadD
MKQASLVLVLFASLCFAHKGHALWSAELETRYQDYFSQAADYRFRGKFESSQLLYRRALALARENGDLTESGRCLRELGYVAWDLGNVREAADLLTEALSAGLEAKDPGTVRSCTQALKIIELYMLGRQERAANENRRAVDHFNRALSSSREAGLPSFYLKSLRQKGLACWSVGSYEDYFECNQRGLDVARQIHHRKEEARFLNNLGIFLTSRGDHYKALEYFEEARDIAEAEKDKSTWAECLNNMATVHMNLGNYHRAERLYVGAYTIDRSLDDAGAVIMDLNNLGNINLKIGQSTGGLENLAIALDYFKTSLSMAVIEDQPATKVQVMNNIGALHHLMGQNDKAGRFFEEGLDAVRSIGYLEAENTFLLNLGLAAFQDGRFPAARSILESTVRSASATNDLDILWEAHYGLGLCHEGLGDKHAALQAYRHSIIALERTRRSSPSDIYKIGFARDRIAPFQRAMDMLYASCSREPAASVLEDIFEIMERAKAQAFLDGIEDDIPGAPLERESRIRRIPDVQSRLLDRRSVLLEYFLGERNSYVLAVTGREARLFRIPAQGQIERSLRAYLKYVSSPPGSGRAADSASARIGRELLFPLEAILDHEVERIIVVPDGILWSLPFETLSLQGDRATGRLIELCEVHYGMSASALLALKERTPEKKHAKALLAFGGSTFTKDQEPMPSLPNSASEIEAIAGLFPENMRDVHLEGGASEEKIKPILLEGYQIIHFAGHGLSDIVRPFRSALILPLAAGRREDGQLQMGEVGQLTVDADLVVLSACRTGAGVLERSEGPLSLSRTFFYAGARSVLASLWDVSDQATGELMKRFYAHLVRGYDTSRALRSAKLDIIGAGRSHPFYWAGFVLSGCPVAATIGPEGRSERDPNRRSSPSRNRP